VEANGGASMVTLARRKSLNVTQCRFKPVVEDIQRTIGLLVVSNHKNNNQTFLQDAIA
jgi:hypothetical protein